MTIMIVILVIAALIIGEESKSKRKSESDQGASSLTSTNSVNSRYSKTNMAVGNKSKINSSQQPILRPNISFVDKFLDAVEQSLPGYDEKVQKEMNQIIDDGFKKDSIEIIDSLINNLDKIIPRDVLLNN